MLAPNLPHGAIQRRSQPAAGSYRAVSSGFVRLYKEEGTRPTEHPESVAQQMMQE
jgi:hypothetical protein